ncbi:hypothetical protein BC938DRAFT_476874 [Jimgerdemannia flammicorona]|uniref:Uncharacterized protein n=1 Tax=Jimgerdemannia flammicorona TaxID=994334 RepID=A0A433PDJ8_9FUNG|nr:hypothetical protein BC938DRAFT_476874 [Jimgerdemannia flammicorona]
MSSTETNFRNSLRNFQSSSRTGPINLGASSTPTEHPNPFSSTIGSIQSGASSIFSNVRNTVQGYVPLPGLGIQEEQQEPSWLQLSSFEVRYVSVYGIERAGFVARNFQERELMPSKSYLGISCCLRH